MGYGLCKNWRNITACDEELLQEPTLHTLVVSLTGHELYIANAYVYSAYTTDVVYSTQIPSLGYSHWLDNPTNSSFWDQLEQEVTFVADYYAGSHGIEDVILYGEFVEEKRFLDVVWKALGEAKEVKDVGELWGNLQVSGFNGEFMAARGAAELAKRWQSEPWYCEEPEWCQDVE